MAKKIHFVLFLGVLCLTTMSVSATVKPVQAASTLISTETCTAPPPDSFRVTSNGGSFITLAWTPAWMNATHALTVSKKDTSGNWIDEYTVPDVPGSSFSVDNLEGGRSYKFTIRTNCGPGDPSALTSFIEHIAQIVELNLSGRTPLDPRPIDCHGIPYKEHEWVGFSVSGEGASSLFEVVVDEGSDLLLGYIKRVYVESGTIVAADDLDEFPNSLTPVLSAPNPFQMLNIGQVPPEIGRIHLTIHEGRFPTIDLCQDTVNPFKSGYTFTALTTESVIITGNRSKMDRTNFTTSRFEAQNPFKDELCIFTPLDGLENEGATVRLLDTDGQTVLLQKLDYLSAKVSFPTGWLSPGVYILQIKTNAFTQSLKVIKSN